jgi:hypothetical protein
MPPKPLKSIFVLYALVMGLFVYFLGSITYPKASAGSDAEKIIGAVNNAVSTRRNDLLAQSLSRKILLERQLQIQQQAFRQQAAGANNTFSVPVAHSTPSQSSGGTTGTIYTSTPAPTPTPIVAPTPTYIKPRTTIS